MPRELSRWPTGQRFPWLHAVACFPPEPSPLPHAVTRVAASLLTTDCAASSASLIICHQRTTHGPGACTSFKNDTAAASALSTTSPRARDPPEASCLAQLLARASCEPAHHLVGQLPWDVERFGMQLSRMCATLPICPPHPLVIRAQILSRDTMSDA